MSSGFPSLTRRDLIKVLLSLGLKKERCGDYDYITGEFNGQQVDPIWIPNDHKTKEYSHKHRGVQTIWKKLGISRDVFYKLVSKYR